jgi:hypothetical protein
MWWGLGYLLRGDCGGEMTDQLHKIYGQPLARNREGYVQMAHLGGTLSVREFDSERRRDNFKMVNVAD